MNIDIKDSEYKAVHDLMYRYAGVHLTEKKKPLIVARLRKRLVEFSLNTLGDYIKYLQTHLKEELPNFISALTTNETYFFRHTKQFNLFFEEILPELCSRKKRAGQKLIKIWSAASSTGEEAYSIAIVCQEFMAKHPGWQFQIYASDIDYQVLQKAREGIYGEKSVAKVTESLMRKYFTARHAGIIKRFELNHQIKQCVTFENHNLMNPPKRADYDVIFLRNVLYYFDKSTQQTVASLLESALLPGGYFFVSLSENLHDRPNQLEYLRNGIYRKADR
ncbi:MAG: protein-glutamate O-methyltransferase CheR [Candidatus Omnitrophica bacterium]|nr:protein-glutamate O-methyltransferase CheR [Candidatus Omnitrophota bacterium]